jgi:hypothetical protein
MVFLIPHEAGIASEAAEVGKRVAKLIEALGSLSWVCEGVLADWCQEMKVRIIQTLRAEGWRFSGGDRIRVLPPENYSNRPRDEARRVRRRLYR